jgi:hypothetical protein
MASPQVVYVAGEGLFLHLPPPNPFRVHASFQSLKDMLHLSLFLWLMLVYISNFLETIAKKFGTQFTSFSREILKGLCNFFSVM